MKKIFAKRKWTFSIAKVTLTLFFFFGVLGASSSSSDDDDNDDDDMWCEPLEYSCDDTTDERFSFPDLSAEEGKIIASEPDLGPDRV